MNNFQGYTKQSQMPQLDREMPLIMNNNIYQDGKTFLQNVKSPQEIKKQRQIQAKKKYDQLLQKVEFFEHNQYERTYIYDKGIWPYIFFFKALARKPEGTEQQIKSTINRLKLFIPDTIVISDDDLPLMWFYSSPEGFVYRTDTFSKRHVSAKLANYASPDELVAIFKKPGTYDDGSINGNDIKLASARELHSMTSNAFQEQSCIQVIQKFVKSNGPKAFVCRTVWRKNQNAYAWIITNKADFYPNENIPNYNTQYKGIVNDFQKYIVQPRNMGSCTIVNTCRGKYVDETIPYVKNIIRYLDIQVGLKFKEFIADFIKDESGIWWMINVKGFKLDDGMDYINLKPITNFGDIDFDAKNDDKNQYKNFAHTKMKVCKYCDRSMPENELNHKMTLKMIIQTDRHLLHRSKGQVYPWIKRSDINTLDPGLLYQEHKVCILCYKIYSETEKLIQTEFEFAQKLGIPCIEDTKHQLLNLKNDGNDMENQQLNYKDMYGGILNDPNVPESWQMDIRDNGRLIMENHQPRVQYQVEKKLYRYRIIIMFDSLMQIPKDIDMNKQYFIQYELFDQVVKYRLDFTDFNVNKKDPSKINIDLDKIRQLYFFSKGQKLTNEDDEYFKINKKNKQQQEQQEQNNAQNNVRNKANTTTAQKKKKQEEDQDDRGRKSVNRYLNIKQYLQIKLLADYQEIGVINLELQDLVTETETKKEFYKFFSGKEIKTLTWGLNLIVGIHNSGSQDVTRIMLDDSEGIYLPSKDYYASDPLPQEWIQLFKDRPDPTNLSSKRRNKDMIASKSWQRGIQINLKSPKKFGNNLSPQNSYLQASGKSQRGHNQSSSDVRRLMNSSQRLRKDSNQSSQVLFSQQQQYNSLGKTAISKDFNLYDTFQKDKDNMLSSEQIIQEMSNINPNTTQALTKKEVKFGNNLAKIVSHEGSIQQHDSAQFANNTTVIPKTDNDSCNDSDLDEMSTLKSLLHRDLKGYEQEQEGKKKIKKKIYY